MSVPARRLWLVPGVALLLAAAALVELRVDPPSVAPPKAGNLAGVIAPAANVAELAAVSRVTGEHYVASSFDRSSGSFRFAGLPGDATYDLCIVTADGRRLEGIDLAWFEARFQRLATDRRRALGLPEPPPHRFTSADAAEILRLAADRPDFAEVVRPMILRADGGRAVMLLERVRADRFHEAGPGELLWRMDLLYFTFDAGGWRIVPDTRRLVERQRFDPAAWRTFAIAYDPALSVVLDADGRAARVRIDLPATTDPATTRTGTMPLRADTPPVVIGQ